MSAHAISTTNVYDGHDMPWDEESVTWYTRPSTLTKSQAVNLYEGGAGLDEQLAFSSAPVLFNVTGILSLHPAFRPSCASGACEQVVSIAVRADGEGEGRGSGDKTLFYSR